MRDGITDWSFILNYLNTGTWWSGFKLTVVSEGSANYCNVHAVYLFRNASAIVDKSGHTDRQTLVML